MNAPPLSCQTGMLHLSIFTQPLPARAFFTGCDGLLEVPSKCYRIRFSSTSGECFCCCFPPVRPLSFSENSQESCQAFNNAPSCGSTPCPSDGGPLHRPCYLGLCTDLMCHRKTHPSHLLPPRLCPNPVEETMQLSTGRRTDSKSFF